MACYYALSLYMTSFVIFRHHSAEADSPTFIAHQEPMSTHTSWWYCGHTLSRILFNFTWFLCAIWKFSFLSHPSFIHSCPTNWSFFPVPFQEVSFLQGCFLCNPWISSLEHFPSLYSQYRSCFGIQQSLILTRHNKYIITRNKLSIFAIVLPLSIPHPWKGIKCLKFREETFYTPNF